MMAILGVGGLGNYKNKQCQERFGIMTSFSSIAGAKRD